MSAPAGNWRNGSLSAELSENRLIFTPEEERDDCYRLKKWYGRWLEDELQPDGSIIRIHRSEILGDKSEFPTKRLAQRELDRRLAAINSPIYRANPGEVL